MTQRDGKSTACVICGTSVQTISRHVGRSHPAIGLEGYWRLVDDELAHSADGHLDDGTPYFGKLGEIAHDPENDQVQCHLCGDWFKWVGGLHLQRRHAGWSITRYREAFQLKQNQSTVATSTRARLRAGAMARLKAEKIGSPLGQSGGLQRKTWQSFLEVRP
jgi:hypothetical protein